MDSRNTAFPWCGYRTEWMHALDRRQIAHQQSHVLNDQRINACVVSLMGEPYGLRQFLIGKIVFSAI